MGKKKTKTAAAGVGSGLVESVYSEIRQRPSGRIQGWPPAVEPSRTAGGGQGDDWGGSETSDEPDPDAIAFGELLESYLTRPSAGEKAVPPKPVPYQKRIKRYPRRKGIWTCMDSPLWAPR